MAITKCSGRSVVVITASGASTGAGVGSSISPSHGAEYASSGHTEGLEPLGLPGAFVVCCVTLAIAGSSTVGTTRHSS